MASRIGMGGAACLLAITALVSTPTAAADPNVVLPPIASTGGGPIIGGGDEAAQSRISLQLTSLGNPDVQEGDGADAAAFIMDSANIVANSRFTSTFVPLQRALGCQKDNTSFGARAYRRADGLWGGAVLVIAQSATANMDALTNCIKPIWPGSTVGGRCASGWTYPTSGQNHRPETYYILLAGTSGDFCASFNSNYANYATRWP